MDCLFLKIAEVIKVSKDTGPIHIVKLPEKNLEFKFINYLTSLIKNAVIPEYYYFCVDLYIEKYRADENFSIEEYKKLLVIKHLAKAVLEQDMSSVLGMSRYFCSDEGRDKLSVINGSN